MFLGVRFQDYVTKSRSCEDNLDVQFFFSGFLSFMDKFFFTMVKGNVFWKHEDAEVKWKGLF